MSKLALLDEGNMWCNDCENWFSVLFNNVPWLNVKYCPFCGEEAVEWIEPEEKEEASNEDDR